jgi:hypothetical protein
MAILPQIMKEHREDEDARRGPGDSGPAEPDNEVDQLNNNGIVKHNNQEFHHNIQLCLNLNSQELKSIASLSFPLQQFSFRPQPLEK